MAATGRDVGNWRTPIVDLLKLLTFDSSLEARKESAQDLGGHAGDPPPPRIRGGVSPPSPLAATRASDRGTPIVRSSSARPQALRVGRRLAGFLLRNHIALASLLSRSTSGSAWRGAIPGASPGVLSPEDASVILTVATSSSARSRARSWVLLVKIAVTRLATGLFSLIFAVPRGLAANVPSATDRRYFYLRTSA